MNDPDKVKYQIYDAIKTVLPHCKNENDLKSLLEQSGIETEFKLKRTTEEIEGISFNYNNVAFKGSEVDRKFSYGNLKKEFEKNKIAQEIQAKKVEQEAINKPKTGKLVGVGGIKFTPEQIQTLKNGGCIYLENLQQKDGTKISAYLFCDDQMKQPFYTRDNPESFVKYGKYEMRLMDKMRIEAGLVTKAKVKWYGGGYAYPHLWKENKSDPEYKESWGDPRLSKVEKKETEPDLSPKLKINRGRKR